MSENNNHIVNLIQYHKTRMDILANYSKIVWNRFNWFTTLELALFSILITKYNEFLKDELYLQIIFFVLGSILTFFWLFLSIEDYMSMQRHKKRGEIIEKKIHKECFLENDFEKVIYSDKLLSQTKILYIFPLIFLILWLTILIFFLFFI